MGLKCSVIGHKYGEASVEREREEQGSEVVITVQERETCDRCGKTRIVSENKEVTSIETPSDIAGEMVDTDEEEEAPAEPDEPAVDDDIAEAEPEADEEEEEAPAVEAVDPDADDAEILDDSDTDQTGGDSELDDPSTVESVPDTGEPVDAAEAETTEPEEDDAVIIDGESDEPADDREPGQWPEEPADDGDDWKPETVMGEPTDDEAEEDDGDDSSGLEPLGASAVTVPDGKFRCPECEFSTDVASSSLRAGDFCPECHKGALVTSEE